MIKKEFNSLHSNGVRVKIVGDKSELSSDIQAIIDDIELKTSQNTVMQLNLMINYGARMEIINTCKKLAEQKAQDPSFQIDESSFSNHLLTSDSPDPDILIRPGGEFRLSNFMLWQLSYAEFFFTDTLWPDFKEEEFTNILLKYQSRHRRFGAL